MHCFLKVLIFWALIGCSHHTLVFANNTFPSQFEKALVVDDCMLLIDQPKGWEMIDFLARPHTFTGAFLPKGYNFQTAPALIYMQCKSKPKSLNLDSFIRKERKDEEKKGITPSSPSKNLRIAKKRCVLQEYTPAGYDPYVVAYVLQKNHVLLFILSAKSNKLLQHHLKNLEEFILKSHYGIFLENQTQNGQTSYVYQMQDGSKKTFLLEK